MVIMLLPICLQQMASVSYDVMLMSISFLYIATIFNLKFSQKEIKIKDLLLLVLYLIIIIICKLPYGVLGLLIFLLPLSKIKIKIFMFNFNGNEVQEKIYKHKFISYMIFILFLFVCVFLIYKYLLSVNSGRVLIASLMHSFDTVILLARTIKHYSWFYADSIVGRFGLFNVNTNFIIDILIIFSVFIISMFNYKIVDNKIEEETIKLTKKDICIIYVTFFILVYFIILAMFEWTLFAIGMGDYNNMCINRAAYYLKTIKLIGGVQGRYFVPILPLLFIPLSNKKLLKLNPILFQIIYYCLLGIYMIVLLLFRFWI